jgi:hypothetical protein
MKTDWYRLSATAVLQQLGSDPGQGLSRTEAQARMARFGANELVEKAGRSRAEIVREQLSGVLTILLIIAALISMVLGDWLEAVAGFAAHLRDGAPAAARPGRLDWPGRIGPDDHRGLESNHQKKAQEKLAAPKRVFGPGILPVIAHCVI